MRNLARLASRFATLCGVLVLALFAAGVPFARADTTSWPIGAAGFPIADTSGNIYLFDATSGWTEKYTNTGTYVGTFGPHVDRVAGSGLAASPDGGIYIFQRADPGIGGYDVVKYDSSGAAVQTIYLPPGSGNGQFSNIAGLGTDASGNIYVLDVNAGATTQNRVQKLSSTGTYISQFGSTGDGKGQFDFSGPPGGHLAVAGDGTVYVSDTTNRIQRFAPDGSFVTTWGSTGSGPGLFEGLNGLAVDTSGHVYAADALAGGNGRAIQEFDSVGNLLATLGNFLATSNSSYPPLMGQVATYGSDLVYAVGFGTIYRLELTVPDASLSVQPSPAHVGQPVTATATASVPFGSVAGYAFDFGVGVPATLGLASVASYTYSSPGTYQVTARVTSARGGIATVAKTITVVSPPINTSPPSIVGAPIERDALTAIHGGWSNPPITGYNIWWLRCDAAGNRCQPLATAGAQKYVLRPGDVGHTIRVVEAALNTTGIAQPATSSPTALVKALPRLTGASASPAAFRAARSGKSVTTSRAIGTKVQYVLNIRASVRFTIDRVLDGRQVGRRCVPPASKSLTARRCSRYVPMRGGFTVAAHAGKNGFRFTGRLSGSALAPGTYRLVATPSANGRSGDAKTITFTIMR